MKNLLLLLILISVISCQGPVEEINSLVGEANASVSKTFDSQNSTQLEIKLTNESYCPGNGIALIVNQDGTNLLTSTISTLPFSQTLPIVKNKPVEVIAKSVPLNNGTNCVRLGNAKLVVTRL